jgi:16S rRNA (guanine527-N7)-methyltransferase
MADAELRATLLDGLGRLGLEAGRGRADRLLEYLELLERWNRTYNLTAVAPGPAGVVRHLLDSLAIAPIITGRRFLDVGSGAGLPGLPLAIWFPERSWTLLDASSKRVRFLRHAAARLDLGHVECVHARVEDYEAAVPFDTVLSRAFSSLGDFAALAGRHVGPEGRVAAMKGRLPADELADLPPGWRVTGLHRLSVPGLEAERHLVLMSPAAGGTARSTGSG